MRLLRLVLEGFRAFSTVQEINLDAGVIIVTGPNGQGKTSVFDGILWALTGQVSRLEGEPKNVLSLYSETGEASAELDIQGDDGPLKIRRVYDGQTGRLQVEAGGSSYSGTKAQMVLAKLFRVEDEHFESTSGLGLPSLHTAVTRSVYLQQDLVREFLEAEDEGSRYENLSQLFGARTITQLQVELERQKASWTKATNTHRQEAEELRSRLRRLKADVEGLASSRTEADIGTKEWMSWWETLSRFSIEPDEIPQLESNESPIELDRALREVEAVRRQMSRRQQKWKELLERASALENEVGEAQVAKLKSEVDKAEANLQEVKKELQQAEAELAAQRLEVTQTHDEAQDRAVFAQFALRYLGEECPVCQQPYNRIKTEERLSNIVSAADEEPILPDSEALNELRHQLSALEQAKANARSELAAAQEVQRDRENLHAQLASQGFKDILASPVEEWVALLAENVAELEERLQQLVELQKQGEDLSLRVARVGELARLEALENEKSDLEKKVRGVETTVQARDETGHLAQRMIEGLRDGGRGIVSSELERVAPAAQRIYSAIDPHPAFRKIDLEATMFGGRGRVSASVYDPDKDVGTDYPEQILSSSQANALALSIFLALNLGSRELPLSTIILDDPLQSLDDINLLGLIDLLRRLREDRQLILSTHDARFAGLLKRKLRPVDPQSRTQVVEVESWDRDGPSVTTREVEHRPQMYIVA